MTPKPITSTTYVVAAFDGARPRFLCRDSRHGHWVVTVDQQKASQFATPNQAVDAASDYRRLGFGRHHSRDGDWRAFAVTMRLAFSEVAAAA